MNQFTMMPETFGDACSNEVVALMNAVGKVWSEHRGDLSTATDSELDMFDAYGTLINAYEAWRGQREAAQREHKAILDLFVNLGRDNAATA